jgi:hypothetical protein
MEKFLGGRSAGAGKGVADMLRFSSTEAPHAFRIERECAEAGDALPWSALTVPPHATSANKNR